jgi:RND family efflux transporter MFP subunit
MNASPRDPNFHRMKKTTIIVLLIAALAGGGWYFYAHTSFASSGDSEIPERFITKAEKRDINFSVEVSGDVTPKLQLDVKAEVGGKIKKLHVDAGDIVKQGDVLVEIDDTDLLTEKKSILSDIDGARLNAEKIKRNFERSRDLFDSKLVSREIFDNLSSEFDISQNDLIKAQRKLQILEDKLSKTKVIAPMDGTVLVLPVIEGQVVIAAASVNNGTTLMTMADLSKLLVITQVNQVDVAKLAQDQRVKLRAEALKDVDMDARISLIAPQAAVKNSIKGFEVRALIENPSKRLRPGMSVNMSIPIARADDAVSVPISAVFKGDGNKKVVYVRNGIVTEKREVKVGVTNIDYVEILKGVSEGETVLLVEPDRGGGPGAPSAPVTVNPGGGGKRS